MPFEYVGLRSLRDQHIFTQIYARAVEQTGLAFNFASPEIGFGQVDDAYRHFSYQAFLILNEAKFRPTKKFWMLIAVAIHAASLFPAFRKQQFLFPSEKVVGLHMATVRKNPNEVIALTFGLSIAAIQFEHRRHPTGLILSPAPVDLKEIDYRPMKHFVRLIAENRNRDLDANDGQFFRSFSTLARLIRSLQRRRLSGVRHQH